MIVLTDEDIGTKVPRALTLVGRDTRSLVSMGWAGRPDTWWLERAGSLGWLVFSANTRMLRVPSERSALVRFGVGIVFLTKGEERIPAVLELLLRKWDDLALLSDTQTRPFARFLSPRGVLSSSWRGLSL
ncbi:MAG: hypothetical protein HYX50_03900 [Chloroflexi bacterium]|nr:hypothetical protein [Chloroflexota bacterium]